MHHFQILALVVCCTALVEGASVVRVPRVYNILIKSDGALAPSEAVSANGSQEEGDQEGDEEVADPSSSEDENTKNPSGDPPQEPLPVLNAKEGAVQEGVNYTQVPLSRAYPLTRYTAPIIAAHYPFPYLHGGLILGPVPKVAAPQKEAPQQPTEYRQRESEDLVDPQLYRQQDERLIQQLPLPQYSRQAQYANAQPSAFRQRSLLPQGAFEDDDTDSVRVEAQEDEEEEEA